MDACRTSLLVVSAVLGACFYHQFIPSSGLGGSIPVRSLQPPLPPGTPSLYAIADIHGDFPRALSALQHAQVVDAQGLWNAGSATLVQTGDIVDRGPDTQKLYHYFRNLTIQAQEAGGQVIKLWGNHEYMNAMYDWRYVDDEDIASFPAPAHENREVAFSINGDIGRDWLIDYKVTHRDAIYRAHFMHAGLNEDHARDPTNYIGQEFMTAILSGNRHAATWTDVQKWFWTNDGPMWYRGYALLPEREACHVAQQVMRILDVDFLVMGHTPNFDGALSRCGGTVLLIDTGLSSAYGGRPVVLEFKTTKNGTREAKLWYDDDVPKSEVVYKETLNEQ